MKHLLGRVGLSAALLLVLAWATPFALADLGTSVTARFQGGDPDPDGNPADSNIGYCGGAGYAACNDAFAPVQVGWGTSGRSRLGFVPNSQTVPASPSGRLITLGTLKHDNQVIGLTEGLVGVDLAVAVDVVDTVRGVTVTASGISGLKVEETSNLTPTCPFNQGFGPNCPDRILLAPPFLNTAVNAGNVRYRVNQVAFQGNSPFMVTAEGAQTSRNLTAVVTRVSRVQADAGPDQTVDETDAVQLDGTGSQVTDLLYEWTQLPGGPPVTLSGASTATPSFTAPELTSSATVTFELTVRDRLEPSALFDSDTVQVTIIDVNDPPIADAGGPYLVDEGSAVTLDGSGSTDPDAGQSLTYEWDYEIDGTPDATGDAPLFDAALRDGPVTVPVALTVCDPFAACDTSDTFVEVLNVAPEATVGGPNVTDEGTAVPVRATGTDVAPADQAILTFAWDSDGDGAFDDAVGPVLTLTPPDGPALISVVVEVCDDDGGCASASGEVAVDNVAPTVDAGLDQTVFRNDLVQLSGSFTDPAGSFDDLYEFGWTGDAPFSPIAGTISYGDSPDAAVVYPTEGVYGVILDVTDKDGGLGTDTLTVTVLNQPPACTDAVPSVGELWPPDHQFRTVTIEGLTDPEGDPLVTTITSIFQDEPVDEQGSGDTTTPDGRGVGTSVAEVKAERSGAQDSRFYHIGFVVDDGHGGSCTGTIRVVVPHDRGVNLDPFDGGPLFDSTVVPG